MLEIVENKTKDTTVDLAEMVIIDLLIVNTAAATVVVVVVVNTYFNYAGNTIIEDSTKDMVANKMLTKVVTIANHYQLLETMNFIV